MSVLKGLGCVGCAVRLFCSIFIYTAAVMGRYLKESRVDRAVPNVTPEDLVT